MDWLKTILDEVVKAFGKTTAPAPTPISPNVQAEPSELIRLLQHLLNQAPMGLWDVPNPPLVEDGWLGPRTEAVGREALEKVLAFLGSR